LSPVDYSVIIGYLAASMAIGLWFARRGTTSMSSFFVGGRQMTWWFAGISIIATAFAADTPLWIGDMIYRRGIEGVWLHWAPGIGAAFYVFTIAPLWRRSSVMTDLEFLELRYSGKAAGWIRGFSGVYYAFFWNIMMMAVGILSVTTLMQTTTGMDKWLCVLITMGTALIYSTVSGIWGVCAADFLQFFVYLFGSTTLAIFAVRAAGGPSVLTEQIHSMTHWSGYELNVLPRLDGMGLPIMTILFIFSMRWIEHTNYGYFVSQRLFSTRSVKHALLAALLWILLYWSFIPLPWIITIISSKVVLPGLTSGQDAYPRMAMTVLPVGLRGIFLVSMLAAFMSTFSSLLNWGSSYVMNDLYRRFLVKKASTRHYVVIGQLIMIPMGIVSACIALYSRSILNLLFYVLLATTGTYTVHLARWIWHRVSAYSEIAGLFGSLLCTLIVCVIFPQWVHPDTLEQYYGHRMFFVMIGTLFIWIIVTLMTPAVSPEVLDQFFKKVRPPGFWGPICQRLNLRSSVSFKQMFKSWLLMIIAIYGPLIGTIKIVFRDFPQGVLFLGIGLIGIVLVVRQAILFSDQ
jgi:SSS family transporter